VIEEHKTSRPASAGHDDKSADAMFEATDSSTEKDPAKTESPGRLLMGSGLGDVHFGPGTRFKLGQLTVSLVHCLSFDRVVLSDPTSGEMRVVTHTDLTPVGPATAEGVQYCALSPGCCSGGDT
jgi:hypothetical protein